MTRCQLGLLSLLVHVWRLEVGGQSTRFQRRFSPSTIWVPGIQTQAIRLRGNHLYLMEPSCQPVFVSFLRGGLTQPGLAENSMGS